VEPRENPMQAPCHERPHRPRYVRILLASAAEKPGTRAISSRVASLTPCSDPNRRSRTVCLRGPIPGISPRSLRSVRLPAGWRGVNCVFVAVVEGARTKEIAGLLSALGADVTLLVMGTPAVDEIFDDVASTNRYMTWPN